MSLVHTFQLGGLRCHALEAGRQRLDGGAMFGVVPKPLWEKRIAPDDRNRIPLAMRCLLIEHPDGLVLVDTGLGNKEDQKFHDIYGIANAGRQGPTQLEDAILEAGHRPADVAFVINTHLHFDHAGGNTVRPLGMPEEDEPALAFPHATYVVQRGELEFARHTNERTRASYLPPNFEPVDHAGRWRLLDGEGEILPGISARLTPGHVPWHQSILVESGDEALLYLADVMPTSAHLPLPWIMGYDLEPMRTLESKRALVQHAAERNWWLFFEHDPSVVMGRVETAGRHLNLASVVAAPTLEAK
ncbi:MAG: MBL fold metallo-hydrolase [Thioalkalivibrio sp.]|nr:MBL fold metallo-hydrolase [Thioalkalivibrio sp.]